ncbi:MAG TPA: Bax inhibitor-1/YccA family protein [Steroidobacteraceae bacterium]|nr:Bax inhibitor-1/YccA family protein [Steroidobacteraceae bacterium]
MDRLPVSSAPADSRVVVLPAAVATSAQRVLRNTYLLLSTTLLFSAACAGVSMQLKLPYPGILLTLVGYYGLFFAIMKLRGSAWSVALVFALTGFMGYTLGPILNLYMKAIPNGGSVIMSAVGITGLTFLGLSAYAVTTRKSFRFMTSFLFIGVLTAFLLGLAAVLFHLPGLSLAVAGLFVLLSSGLILWQTSEIVNGGETNYVLATVGLYVQIFNLFTSLLQLLGYSSRN